MFWPFLSGRYRVEDGIFDRPAEQAVGSTKSRQYGAADRIFAQASTCDPCHRYPISLFRFGGFEPNDDKNSPKVLHHLDREDVNCDCVVCRMLQSASGSFGSTSQLPLRRILALGGAYETAAGWPTHPDPPLASIARYGRDPILFESHSSTPGPRSALRLRDFHHLEVTEFFVVAFEAAIINLGETTRESKFRTA